MQAFYQNKTVLVTGHTGFKGSWLCSMLKNMGADVIGYSMFPPTVPSLFELVEVADGMTSIQGDVRDFRHIKSVFDKYQPEIVFHLAAQPIVRESYVHPAMTYETNVMGTVHVLECARLCPCVKSVVNVTTDKVYQNNEWEWGYRENDSLDGFDPYSNSKSCSELVTYSYKRSFFQDDLCRISTARAGNVIGGGDFAKDRIIPDCVRAALKKETIIVRNPHSIRPYQHVLEPLYAYLLIAQKQYEDPTYQGAYNIGPDEVSCVNTGTIVELFCQCWGEDIQWEVRGDGGSHEANYLKLDCSKVKRRLGWFPKWKINQTLYKTVEWYREYECGGDVSRIMKEQMEEYIC